VRSTPAARQNDKAPRVVAPLDDLCGSRGYRSFNLPPVVAAMGLDQFEPRTATAYFVEDQSGLIAVLDRGRVDGDPHRQPFAIGPGVDLAALHLLAGVVTHASAAGRRDEATDKSIWRAANDWPAVRILAPQHGVIRHREPAGIVGIVGEDQDLPMALFHPRFGRYAVMYRAARLAIRSGERAIPDCQRIRSLMR